MMDKTMILKPRLSEKAYELSQTSRVYVFVVPKGASKLAIASAVQAQFKVTVEDVNTTVIKGKAKRTIRKGGRPIAGRMSDIKKAYVTVKEGDTIPLFAAVEESEKKAAKAAAKEEKK